MDAERAAGAWRFDRFTLDIGRGALLGPDGAEVPLRPKSLALLRLLVENPGRVVDRDAIMEAVWPGVTVGDESITQCIRDIRKALGDEAQQLLKTVPKRGYLLAAEVTPAESTAPTPRVERRLAAILAADIVGYSRLIEQDEAATLAAIKGLREQAIDPLLAEHKGRIVKLMGDGAIVEFASVVDAVACAVAVQKAVGDRQAKTPADKRIVFRIGVNLGDVVVEGDDLMGDGVNIAARLEQLAEPGGVLVSGTAFDHLQGRLGMPLEFTGEQQVKNIARPVRAYRVRLDGQPVRLSPTRPSAQTRQRLVLTAAALLFAVIFAGGIWKFWPVEPPPAKPSIAVLPLDNLAGGEATGRFADGLTEDIITDLARFGDLDVIARRSVEAYKGKAVDVRQVGRDLDVRYVLEGSIQRLAGEVRVTAQLIDARTGAHVWSDRWDRPAREVFAIQTELSERVAARLAVNVIQDQSVAAAHRKPPEDLEAYDLVLLAYEAQKRGTRADIEQGLAYVDAAIARDPAFARAYTRKAWLLLNLNLRDPDKDYNATYAEMERLARKALELDPNYSGGHITLAFAESSLGNNDAARASTARALELNPSSADTLNQAAEAMPYYGEPERGAELCERSFRLNPNPPPYYYMNCVPSYFFVGRFREAANALDHWVAQGGNLSDANQVWRALLQAELGQDAAAATTIDELSRRQPEASYERLMNTGWVFERAQEQEQTLAAVRKVGLRICATQDEIKEFSPPRQLPECEAERAKAPTSAKAG